MIQPINETIEDTTSGEDLLKTIEEIETEKAQNEIDPASVLSEKELKRQQKKLEKAKRKDQKRGL